VFLKLYLLLARPSIAMNVSLVGMITEQDPTLRAPVLSLALRAHNCAVQRGDIWTDRAERMLTIIDYGLPSIEPRLWVIDVQTGQILFAEYVSHGESSGDVFSWSFSNDHNSHQSSLGLFRTAEIYQGTRGLSLRLDGLESQINDEARERLIVVHGAPYNAPKWVEQGQLGRSWGCPALDLSISDALIHTIAGGSLLFAYGSDPEWLNQSIYLDCPG
jgi:hypothetical protein